MNEKELIEACKNNDVRAQKLLYETFARKMMSVCLRYADNREKIGRASCRERV